jgi:Protein of unknown function (DUF3108)
LIWCRKLLPIVVCFLLLVFVRAQTPQNQLAQSAPQLPAPHPGLGLPAKQSLTYSVDWRVFPAGTVTFHQEAEGDVQRITVVGDSIGAVNLIYRVSDRFQSSFNRRTGCSAGFSKQLIEGRRQVNSDLKFDYAQSKAILDEKNLVSGITKHQETAIPSCVSDLLSALFYTASQPFQVGQSFQIPVFDAGKTIPVTMKIEGKESVKTLTGTYQTVRVQPTADAGVVKNRGNIWIWYTDDERHMPVQMRARLFWGTITFSLTNVDQK